MAHLQAGGGGEKGDGQGELNACSSPVTHLQYPVVMCDVIVCITVRWEPWYYHGISMETIGTVQQYLGRQLAPSQSSSISRLWAGVRTFD